MALNPANFTKLIDGGNSPSDPLFVERLTIPGDSSYPTGGYAGFKSLYQQHTLRGSTPISVTGRGLVSSTAYYLEYDVANDKLLVLVAATGIEAANATDLSTATFTCTVISK